MTDRITRKLNRINAENWRENNRERYREYHREWQRKKRAKDAEMKNASRGQTT